MMSYREGTLLGENVEELHAMRVSSRRLRAAMDGFEAVFPRRSYRPFRRQVKATKLKFIFLVYFLFILAYIIAAKCFLGKYIFEVTQLLP